MSSGTCWHCEGDHDTGACPTRKQWTKGEHQPGSPGAVDLDELERLLATHRTSTDADAVTDAVVRLTRALPRMLAEVRTLRARVESYAMDLAALEGTNAANERALRIQLERLQEERSRAESAEARVKELEARSARRFPIMGGPSIPWEMIAPCERQAQSNHQQSLERLAERGGLDPTEALAVLESRRWHWMDPAFALASLAEAVRRWEDRPLQARITDLESQLAAAREGKARLDAERTRLVFEGFTYADVFKLREESELEAKVREVLRGGFEVLKFERMLVNEQPAWFCDTRIIWPHHSFVSAPTLPALLRAILEVEAKGAR
jgi:hypothetical protein